MVRNVITRLLNRMAGFCLCGCGTPVKSKWVRGHYARINNPSNDPAVREKQGEASRRRAAEGGLASFAGWNRGLNAENDPRVAAYGQKISEGFTDERRQKAAESCKKQWKEGRIHAAKGPAHGHWRGGVSNLQQRTRAALYSKWSRPIMSRDRFKCQMCHSAKGGDLCVHHDAERFAVILSKIVAGRDVSAMSFEEQGLVVDEVVRYHQTENVSGITLCRTCHDAVHAMDPDTD